MRDVSPRALRKFGLSVGGVFLVLAAVSRWRGHATAPLVLAGLGSPLVLLGAAAPALLAPVERAWMAMAEVLGRVNTRLILTALYWIVFTPVGALRRLGTDPLNRRMDDGAASDWVRRERKPVDPERYRHQF